MLRKGPEHVPNSLMVLFVAIGLLLMSTFVSTTLVTDPENSNVLISLLSSIVGYFLYWFVLFATGFAHRVVPTIASIMACGSILTILMVAAFVMLAPFLGVSIASIIVWLILIWSVPVKGHIIARAINRHWYLGIVIAMTIFILQYIVVVAGTAQNTV